MGKAIDVVLESGQPILGSGGFEAAAGEGDDGGNELFGFLEVVVL